MLLLEALSHFDFFAKVDVDVYVTRPIEIASPMLRQRAHWLHTFDVQGAWSRGCSSTLHAHMQPYLAAAGCTTEDAPTAFALANRPGAWPTFYTNFVAGWLGLFQSPQLLQFAQYWWSWPGGWRYRWSDQEFWTAALSVTDSWAHVVNHSEWRGTRFLHCDAHATRGYVPECQKLAQAASSATRLRGIIAATRDHLSTSDIVRMHSRALLGRGRA